MPNDPDLIRVDLLRVKRKMYLSYGDDKVSKENFILMSKLSEIEYLTNLVPDDVASKIFTEYSYETRLEVIDILISMGFGILVSMLLFLLHLVYKQSTYLSFIWILPIALAIVNSIKHLRTLQEFKKELNPFKEQYNEIQDKIKKLSDGLWKMDRKDK